MGTEYLLLGAQIIVKKNNNINNVNSNLEIKIFCSKKKQLKFVAAKYFLKP